jgi:YHS domain-containing protein
MKTALIALMASALVAGGMANAAKTKTKATDKAKPALVCPVTGEKIESIAKAAGHSTYKGKTYYFCCGSCKPDFDKNPAKYIKTTTEKPKKGA